MISNVQVTVVCWSSAVAFQSTINSFYTTITNSTYIDWLNEYHTNTQGIGRGSFLKAVTDPNPPSGTTVTQTQIEGELQRLIQIGTLSQPSANNLYMVYFPPGVTIHADKINAFSCTTTSGFCGFHFSFPLNGTRVYYGVIADLAPCGLRCGPSTALANTTSTSSHELLEAITDPDAVNNTAWLDTVLPTQSFEISDLCQDMQVSVSGFTVQKAWSNLQNDCVFSNPCLTCASGTSCRCGDFVCRANNSFCP